MDKLHPPSSKMILDRNGEMLRAFLASDDMWRIRVTHDEISPDLRKAVLSFEDRYFNWHFGINPFAIIRAAAANLRAGRVVQGGSTITMQVARMLQPKARTFGNKLVEAFRALQLEWHYSKEEILTFYFNMAPYGGNIVGVGAASYLYFGKRPDQLSLGQAALLAAIPNSPNRFRPDLNNASARQARERVLSRLLKRGKISKEEMQETRFEPLPSKRFALPFRTPHLAITLSQIYPHAERLETTIDGSLQDMAHATLATHLKGLRSQGIHNGAVVIIENKMQAVRALVGSNDFFDASHDGQVNGATAPRSPGSALKPFVYALGLEHGLISPLSLLNDVPIEYSGYKPVNYDGAYNGMVSTEEALVRSLNVPAVNLYAQLGQNGIYSFLQEAGVRTLPKPKDHYGLSLILGGGEVTLLELTNLYSGLANGGRFQSVRYLQTESLQVGKKLLSPGTCFILTEMLGKLRRPELPAVWDATVDIPKVAWKTGTSYGHRDAWSIGYTPDYTVGVWVGNFNGKGVPALVGAEAAAPVLFAIFDALSGQSENRWFVQPPEVETRQVCSISGMPLGDFCVSVQNELYLPGISPNQACSIHRRFFVDRKTGSRLCSHCRIGRSYDEHTFEYWPAEIASWRSRNGHSRAGIPEHFKGCTKAVAGAGPVINSPVANAEYKIRTGVSLTYQKILLDAAVSNQTQNIYWFLDGKIIYSGPPDRKVFLKPERGRHTLLCMDDEGRSTEVALVIR